MEKKKNSQFVVSWAKRVFCIKSIYTSRKNVALGKTSNKKRKRDRNLWYGKKIIIQTKIYEIFTVIFLQIKSTYVILLLRASYSKLYKYKRESFGRN